MQSFPLLRNVLRAVRVHHCHASPGTESRLSCSASMQNCTIPICSYSSSNFKEESYFITTPIFYVNAQPHIGHLYSVILADAAQRFKKMSGVRQVLFSTGTDEHGLKIAQAASRQKLSPAVFCDQVSALFRDVFNATSIEYTNYVRTTDHSHEIAVKTFVKTLNARGHLYKGTYSGWYCISDEAFLKESEVKEELRNEEKVMVSVESGNIVEWSSEDNYMFRLSNFTDDLLYWLKDENRVRPYKFADHLTRWIKEGLPNLSLTRPRSRVPWGIAMPGDDSHNVYVWVDALTNYLTVAGYPGTLKYWPPDIQVLGKDILRFHGIYWPALLMAAGLEPPKTLICHSHWTVEGEKMSKSRGNVICPVEASNRFTPDGLRYLLLREGTLHSDNNWNQARMTYQINSELADTLGNLASRCTAESLNPDQLMPPIDDFYFSHLCDSGQILVNLMCKLSDDVSKNYEEFNFYHGIEQINGLIRQANTFVQDEKPWDLKKIGDKNKLNSVLRLALETCRISSLALLPVIPNTASALLDSLGITNCERTWHHLKFDQNNLKSFPLGKRIKLFAKII